MKLETKYVTLQDDMKYEYPEGLDLHPQSPLHKRIVEQVVDRARESFSKMSEKHETWRMIDRNLTAYVPRDLEESVLKNQDSRKPVSIVLPMSFAIRESLLTYLTQALLGDSYFTYEGVGPEDSAGAIYLTHLVQQQCIRSKAELALMTQWSDALTYGFGVCVPVWDKILGNGYTNKPMTAYNEDGQLITTGIKRTLEKKVLWEGNKLYTIDPYYFLPDPNVSITNIQDGEFVGWLESSNKVNLLSKEQEGLEGYFNCKFLNAVRGRSVLKYEGDAGREDRYGGSSVDPTDAYGEPVDLIVMCIKIIPAEWELGDSEYPEKWVFAVANDSLVIKCAKLDNAHDMFPVSVCAPDYDGYTISPLSRMELVYGQQETLDWLISSHIKNVRKTVNNTFVIDPMLVNEHDVREALKNPGGYIRMNQSSWGQGVKGIDQLRTSDITRGNIADAGFISQFMERVSSAPGAIQGIFDQGAPERRTAREYEGTIGSAQARLARLGRVVSAQQRDLAYMLALNTQQFMEEETYVKIGGELFDLLSLEYSMGDKKMPISPRDIDINFDIAASDGSIPSERNGQLSMELLKIGASSPLFGVDLRKLFMSTARRLGEKNIHNYMIPIEVAIQNNAEVEAAANAGKLRPANV